VLQDERMDVSFSTWIVVYGTCSMWFIMISWIAWLHFLGGSFYSDGLVVIRYVYDDLAVVGIFLA
jgi:hypothetical protein